MPVAISNMDTVRTAGLWLPAMAGVLASAYVDHCAAGFGPPGLWLDGWNGPFGMVRTIGVDAFGLRVRVVIERAGRDL